MLVKVGVNAIVDVVYMCEFVNKKKNNYEAAIDKFFFYFIMRKPNFLVIFGNESGE